MSKLANAKVLLLAALTALVPVVVLGSGEIKIVCIGDSITAGRYYNWRYHLSRRLAHEGYSQLHWVGSQKPTPVDYLGNYPSSHEGYYGATAVQVAGFSKGIIDQEHPDLAVIDLGTNDISQKTNLRQSADEIGSIIDNLRAANPKVKVLVCLIPHPDGADAFNQALRAMTNARQNSASPLVLVDLASDWNNKPDADTYDWVHPNLRGVLKISDRLNDALVVNLPAPESATTTPRKSETEVNLAEGKPVRASAELGGKAAWAVDGDPMNMWEATPVSTQPLIKPEDIVPQWLEIDLGKSTAVGGSGIIWDIAGASYDYVLATSEDQTNWMTVVAKSNNPELSVALEPEIDRFAAHGRFVRVTVTRVPIVNFPNYRTGLPAAIREFQIFQDTPGRNNGRSSTQ